MDVSSWEWAWNMLFLIYFLQSMINENILSSENYLYWVLFYLSNSLSVCMFYLYKNQCGGFFFYFFTLRTLSFQWPWGSDCSRGRGARWTRGRQWGWMGASGTSQQIISHSTGWLRSDSNYWYFWWSYKV